MTLLYQSARAAATGMTDTQTVADALTTVMKSFNIPASQASHVMDIMTATVKTGKVEWADYAKVIGIVAVNAQQAHIKFTDASAAFSVLTNVMHGSRQAAQSLDALLQTSSRFDILAMRAKAMGLAFDEGKYKTLDLAGRLEYLKTITGGNEQEMTKLLGRQNAVAAATILLSGKMSDYDKALRDIMHSSGMADAAFAKTQQGFKQQAAQLGASFDVLKISLGSALLPLLNQFMQWLTPLVVRFADWETKTHGIEHALAAAGGVINNVVGFVKGLLAPTGQLTGAWQAMQPILASIGGFLKSTFAPVWQQLQGTIKQLTPLWNQLVRHRACHACLEAHRHGDWRYCRHSPHGLCEVGCTHGAGRGERLWARCGRCRHCRDGLPAFPVRSDHGIQYRQSHLERHSRLLQRAMEHHYRHLSKRRADRRRVVPVVVQP